MDTTLKIEKELPSDKDVPILKDEVICHSGKSAK